MIKAHYIATIVIDANIPEDTPDLIPFDKLTERWDGLDKSIKELVEDEICGSDPVFTVAVNKRYSHIYKSEDKA